MFEVRVTCIGGDNIDESLTDLIWTMVRKF